MAALVAQARLARESAVEQRLRAETLRISVHENAARSRELVAAGCSGYARRSRIRAGVRPSPWSTLAWQDADDELDAVLTPVR